MKFSVFSWFGYFMPMEERLDVIAEAGFDEVMLSWEDEMAPRLIKKEAFPEMVRSRGLEITNIHAPYIGYNDIWEKDAAGSQALLSEFLSFVEDCDRFGIKTMVVHTNDLDLGPHSLDKGLRFFETLGEAGEKYGVNIAVENVSRPYLLRYLLDTISLDHFGMCYDTSHDYMLHCGRGKLLKDYGHRILAIHLSDNDLHLDRHWIPGEGWIPFVEVIPDLLALGVDTLSFEVNANKAWQQRSPLEFCQRLRHSLDNWL